MARVQPAHPDKVTWKEPKDQIIYLVNRSRRNFILNLPSGQYRLDAGSRMRTLRTVLEHPRVRAFVDAGELAVEEAVD